jgi:hypothetical protein
LNYSASKISQAFERGKTVDAMIEKLVDQKSNLRRDVALAALNEAIPTKKNCATLWFLNCQLDESQNDVVSDVAELLIKETILAKNDAKTKDAVFAISVLEERKPSQSVAILSKLLEELELRPVTSPTIVFPTISSIPIKPLENPQTKQARIVTALIQSIPEQVLDKSLQNIKLVYIQYTKSKLTAQKLQSSLKNAKLFAPGVQFIQSIKQTEIRYPNQGNLEAAKALAAEVEKLST